MTALKTIQEIYRPIQPAINNNSQITYLELKPIPELSNYIYCYWQLKTNQPLLENFTYKVVTDGCMDIFWETNTPNQNFITGFSNQYSEFPLTGNFNYFGVRFLPTALPVLFKINASELTNKFEDLQSVIPQLSKQLSEKTEAIFSLQKIKPTLDFLFSNHLSPLSSFDDRLFNAINIILKSKGTLKVEKDLNVGISSRQLRRLFNFYIGDSPKAFCKVVRFQNLLTRTPSLKKLQDDKVYFDLGYYDQTHFIKEFKHLYGSTPTDAFK